MNPYAANERERTGIIRQSLVGLLSAIVVALALAFCPEATVAGIATWDGNGGPPLGGSGSWDTTSNCWWTGSACRAWNNAAIDDAVFDTAPGTVTIGNTGDGPLTKDIPVRFTLRAGPGCTGSQLDQWTETLTNVSIAEGAAQTFTITDRDVTTGFCPDGDACGLSVVIELDYTQAIKESDEANNTFCADKTAPARCLYALSLAQESFGPEGGQGEVRLSASDNACDWSAVSNAGWITITQGDNGTDNTTVRYTVEANTGVSRTGTITIAGNTFTVQQENCLLTITPEKVQMLLWGRDQAREQLRIAATSDDPDVDPALVLALLKLFQYAGPFKAFLVKTQEGVEFSRGDRLQWSPDSIKTLLRLSLGPRTMFVLAYIQPLKAEAGPYTLTVGGCSATMTLENL